MTIESPLFDLPGKPSKDANLYVVRQQLIARIRDAIAHQRHVMVTGPSGFGKTALLYYIKNGNPFRFENIHYLNGQELAWDASPLTALLITPQTHIRTLVLIDDLDEQVPAPVKEMLLRVIKEGRKYGQIVIMASREPINEKVFYNNNAIQLKLLGFDAAEVQELLRQYYSKSKIPRDFSMEFMETIEGYHGNPAIIKKVLEFLSRDNFNFDAFRKFLQQEINYHNKPLIEVIKRPELILPETKEIITDLKMVNHRILDRIGRNPAAVFDLQPREFEILVAELFEEKGYHVTLTQATRDGGKDLMILDNRLGNFLIYAECKQFAPHRPVGVSIVSDLVGRMEVDRATAGIVVTTSYFSPDAQVFTEKIKHRMGLVGYLKLEEWIQNGM